MNQNCQHFTSKNNVVTVYTLYLCASVQQHILKREYYFLYFLPVIFMSFHNFLEIKTLKCD